MLLTKTFLNTLFLYKNLFIRTLRLKLTQILKCYYDQKITFIFSSDFETMFIKHSASEIISLNFEKKIVNLNCNFPF